MLASSGTYNDTSRYVKPLVTIWQHEMERQKKVDRKYFL